MNIDKYTQKSRELLQAAVQLAESKGHPHVEIEHFYYELLNQFEISLLNFGLVLQIIAFLWL